MSTQELVQLLKFSGQLLRYKYKLEDTCLKVISLGGKKQRTILHIGIRSEEELLAMKNIAGPTGKVIAFSFESEVYNRLFLLKKLFKWSNISLEQICRSFRNGNVTPNIAFTDTNASSAAVIHLKHGIAGKKNTTDTLDRYCADKAIWPDLIKIDVGGLELNVLEGAMGVLSRYKPQVILVCEERLSSQEKMMKAFKLLTGLNYKGYFILDTIRIPLANFDFNMYQNPNADFFCKHFIFE